MSFPDVSPLALAAPQTALRPAPSATETFPRIRERYWLHGLLLVATVFTTLVVGAQLERNFLRHAPMFSFATGFFPVEWLWRQPANLLLGIPFCFTLMAILLAHELGHYIACRYYRVEASLPYFLPAPTAIGTMGAFIRIRSPIPSRAALFDIGIAGPIAGFVLALPALGVGMALSYFSPSVARASDLPLGYPPVFYAAAALVPHAFTRGFALQDLCLHPVAFAAWIGMFATALNLLPGGQLDGGHILYALSPRLHRALSKPLLIALLLMSPFLWLGWLVWALALSFFSRHPQVPELGPLGHTRRVLALCGLLIFLLSFTPVPFPGTALDVKDVVAFAARALHHIAPR